MCFHIHHRYSEEQTATEAITVYKLIFLTNISLHKHFQYTPNKLYRLRKKLKITNQSFIYAGFHSYQTDRQVCRLSNAKVVKFTIPKGAKYYYNAGFKEYVSSSIRSGDLVAL